MARGTGEAGTVINTMIIFPLAMIVFFIAVHFMLVFHGRSMAYAAAQEGLYWAQLEDGTAADGEAAATRMINNAPGLANVNISVNQTDDEVTVTVTGEVETALVELFDTVNVTVTGPRERFYFEDERR